MNDFINSLGIILYATLIYATPLLYAALGSCFSEVSGVVNIGIEGMMTAGAFTGTVVAYFTGNPWIGFLCGGLAGALFGALHALATVKLGADQTIAGTAINMLGPASSSCWPRCSSIPRIRCPWTRLRRSRSSSAASLIRAQ